MPVVEICSYVLQYSKSVAPNVLKMYSIAITIRVQDSGQDKKLTQEIVYVNNVIGFESICLWMSYRN